MKGIVKMDKNGNPSIVLPGVEMKLVGPLADKFKGLPQQFADMIEVDCTMFSYVDSAPRFAMGLTLKDNIENYIEKKEAPEAATSGASMKGSSDGPVETLASGSETVKGKEVL